MTITLIGLIILIFGYSCFLFFDGCMQERHAGKTLVAVRLRRRLGDLFFLLFVVLAGIYYELTQGKNTAELIALFVLSGLILWQGLRYPKWRLKKEGFIFGGRYWRYEAIAAMQLSEDGILVLSLHSGQNIFLPVAKIEDLEKAAAFFTSEEILNPLFNKEIEEKENV